MFIRVTSTPNSPRKSIKIVANYREGYKVKQKIIHHLGIASDPSEIEKLKLMGECYIAQLKKEQAAANPQQELFESDAAEDSAKLKEIARLQPKRGRKARKTLEEILPASQVSLDEIVEQKRVIEGLHEIGGHMYDQLGYSKLLPSKRDNSLLKDMVLMRLANPSSKHKTQQLLDKQCAITHDLDKIYRLMDKLNPLIEEIKRKTFQATKALMPDTVDLILFDVTTLYFETVQKDELRAFGYSKDFRFNTSQVVLALATNKEGLPIGYELFSGNTAEVSTLCACIDSWQQQFEIGQVCFIGDRAMMSEANVQLLSARGYQYIIAAKLKGMSQKMRQALLEEENYQPTVVNNELAWIGEFSYKGQRLIVSYKTDRARHDVYKRTQILNKLAKKLNKDGVCATQKLMGNTGVNRYTTTEDSISALDNDKIAREAEFDGLHGVITNIDKIDAIEVIQRYSRLWVIEESFRLNKHTLKMRPIYHFKPERIQAHIALCYMAFALLRHLQYHVALTKKLSPQTILDTLKQVQASIYVHKKTGDRYRVPGAFTHEATQIYRAFKINRDMNVTAII